MSVCQIPPNVFMVLGLIDNLTDWESLAIQIETYWKSHVPGLTNLVVLHYDGDPTAPAGALTVQQQIASIQPNDPLCLCGHSYGGGQAVLTAAQLALTGRNVDHLILFDPVPVGQGGKPAVPSGFALSSNVIEAIAFPRGATENPFSCSIASGPNFQNLVEPGDPNTTGSPSGSANNHGFSVWNGACLSYLAKVMIGNNFLSTTVVPTPVPAPTLKTITSVTTTVDYSDGSSKVTICS